MDPSSQYLTSTHARVRGKSGKTTTSSNTARQSTDHVANRQTSLIAIGRGKKWQPNDSVWCCFKSSYDHFLSLTNAINLFLVPSSHDMSLGSRAPVEGFHPSIAEHCNLDCLSLDLMYHWYWHSSLSGFHYFELDSAGGFNLLAHSYSDYSR